MAEESVLFENSPLHSYLMSVGYEEVDVETTHKTIPQCLTNKREHKEGSAFTYLTQILTVCSEFILSFLPVKSNVNKLNEYYKQKTFEKLVKSDILLEMDADAVNDHAADVVKQHTFVPRSIPWIKAGISSVSFPCLIAYVTARCLSQEHVQLMSHLPIIDIFIVSTTLIAVTTLIKDIQLYKWQRHMEGLTSLYDEFVQTSVSLTTLVKKSFRLVRERELIVRGFSVSSAVSQLGSVSSQQCLKQSQQLRQTLFLVVRSSLLDCRNATLQLFDEYPLTLENDCDSSYVATVDLDDYGQCLHLNSNEELETLHEITDGFSVTALKAMNHLFFLHLSQFIRRLALCFCTSSEEKDPFVTENLVNDLNERLLLKRKKLEQSFKFHQNNYKQMSPMKKSLSQSNKMEQFHSTVSLLDIHLQSTLLRVHELSSEIELTSEPSSEEARISDELVKTKWLPLMTRIKSELSACQECWEDAMSKIKKPHEVPKLDHIPKWNKKEENIIPFSELEEYIVEDQVWEAYSDPDYLESKNWYLDQGILPEEKDKREKEKENVLKLLTELKSVISVKAEETMRREKLALDRQKGVSDTQRDKMASSNENSDLSSPGHEESYLHKSEQTSSSEENMENVSQEKDKCYPNSPDLIPSDQNVDSASCQHNDKLTVSEGTEQSQRSSVEIFSQWSSDIVNIRKLNDLKTESEEQNTDLIHNDEITNIAEDDLQETTTQLQLPKQSVSENFKFITLSQQNTECSASFLVGSSMFSASVAAVAAAQSKHYNLNIETFGDSSNDDSDDCGDAD